MLCIVTSDMKLAPNVGSDRSWVWKSVHIRLPFPALLIANFTLNSVLADVADGEVTAETLAVRFGNSDNANLFKSKFEEAQSINAGLSSSSEAAAAPPPPTASDVSEASTDKPQEEEKKVEKTKAEEAAEDAEKAKKEEGGDEPPVRSTLIFVTSAANYEYLGYSHHHTLKLHQRQARPSRLKRASRCMSGSLERVGLCVFEQDVFRDQME